MGLCKKTDLNKLVLEVSEFFVCSLNLWFVCLICNARSPGRWAPRSINYKLMLMLATLQCASWRAWPWLRKHPARNMPFASVLWLISNAKCFLQVDHFNKILKVEPGKGRLDQESRRLVSHVDVLQQGLGDWRQSFSRLALRRQWRNCWRTSRPPKWRKRKGCKKSSKGPSTQLILDKLRHP